MDKTELEKILDEAGWGDYQKEDGTWAYGISNKGELVDRLLALYSQAVADAIDSLPKIRDGEYYFVSGKDIDKTVKALSPAKEAP